VVRADVAVTDAPMMKIAEGPADADHDSDEVVETEGVGLGEGLSFDDREVEFAALVVIDHMHDLDDTGMASVGEHGGLVANSAALVCPAPLGEGLGAEADRIDAGRASRRRFPTSVV